jgi:hypothetical protein
MKNILTHREAVRLVAIFLFDDMNDIILNKKICTYIGEHEKTVKDRAYTRERKSRKLLMYVNRDHLLLMYIR